jgi:hypothetical protein
MLPLAAVPNSRYKGRFLRSLFTDPNRVRISAVTYNVRANINVVAAGFEI